MERDVVYSTPIEETLGDGAELFRDDIPTTEYVDRHTGEVKTVPLVVDDELGLEVVHQPTVFEKYGIKLDSTSNNFHKSLEGFYERNGYLTEKQLKCFK